MVGQHSPLRALLVEDDLADQSFLRAALIEGASADGWPGCQGVHVVLIDTLEDACDVAFEGGFDVILLNLSLPDSPVPYQTFSQMMSVVNGIPLIVLADDDDPGLAAHLLREGAQDVLAKHSVDAGPLTRAVRSAVERQRFVNGICLAAAPVPSRGAALPDPPPNDDLLLSLVGIAAVTAQNADVETVMLAD